MDDFAIGLIFFIALFFSMLLFVYLGRCLCLYQAKKHPERKLPKSRIIDGAIFALLGLLIAFTFAGARERFDVRRLLVIDEANAIRTAYLRLDLLPAQARMDVQSLMRQYLNTRLAIYKKMPHINQAIPELKQSQLLEQQIWNISVQACKQEGVSSACIVLLPALNQMIDVANTRFESTRIHPPTIILIALIGLALFSAILAGYSISNTSNWPLLHIFLYAVIISFTIFIIINLEYPRFGFIPINYFDEVLVDLSNTMIK